MSDDDEIRVPASYVDDILDRAVDLAVRAGARGGRRPAERVHGLQPRSKFPRNTLPGRGATAASPGEETLIAFVILVGCCASMGGLLATWMSAESERS